jgi:hypothetical protein
MIWCLGGSYRRGRPTVCRDSVTEPPSSRARWFPLCRAGAPVSASVIVLAVLLAIAGGLVAGSFGGWRAARLRPAEALARLE